MVRLQASIRVGVGDVKDRNGETPSPSGTGRVTVVRGLFRLLHNTLCPDDAARLGEPEVIHADFHLTQL